MRPFSYLLTFMLFLSSWGTAECQVFALFNSCVFNTPANRPFVETYLTIQGASLFAKEENGLFRNSVNVEVRFMKDSAIIKANKYNLHGPSFQRGKTAPSFIDCQRYSLPNGEYEVVIDISDNHSLRKKTLTIVDRILVDFNNEISFSGIEAIESASKSYTPGPLSKSGLDMIPYIVNFYPESSTILQFYCEAYNTSAIFGKGAPFLFVYYIENESKTKMESFGSFKKQTAENVNPLLGKIDISKLGSGAYRLIVELKDAENVTRASAVYHFERQNRLMEVSNLQSLSHLELEGKYFGTVKDADTLKMFVECLWPIANGLDKERIINQSLRKDPEMMKKFMIDFWERRAADTADALQMWGKYYQSVQQVMVLFKCGKQKGYYTDRGRVYLQYGAPSQRSVQNNEENTYPYEIWQYYRTTDQSTGQFFSNRKFVFVNRQMGDDCHQLIHSDMRGEISNPRWQFELTRRNNNGLANPDNTTPAGTDFNQFNEIYSNPR